MVGKKPIIDDLVLGEGEVLPVQSRLRHNILKMPDEIQKASGIVVNGRRLRSFLFSTDLAIIHNCNADAVFAVYPFTAHRSISQGIIHMAPMPVFCGVGGGTTQGVRAVYLATDAEAQGAAGLVLNAPFPNTDLRRIARVVDIPIVVTVTNPSTNIGARLRSGASILNVAGGRNTVDMVAKIRAEFPKIPIMASSGRTPESIAATVEAGANAIVYTPLSSAELFRDLMDSYRP